jgi:hypothetical protein
VALRFPPQSMVVAGPEIIQLLDQGQLNNEITDRRCATGRADLTSLTRSCQALATSGKFSRSGVPVTISHAGGVSVGVLSST